MSVRALSGSVPRRCSARVCSRPALAGPGLLALLLVQIRNWFGLLSVLATGLAVFAVSWWRPEQAQSAFAFFVAWFLLMAAPRPVIELQLQRRRREVRNSDADQLAGLTGVPGILWVGVFLVATSEPSWPVRT